MGVPDLMSVGVPFLGVQDLGSPRTGEVLGLPSGAVESRPVGIPGDPRYGEVPNLAESTVRGVLVVRGSNGLGES